MTSPNAGRGCRACGRAAGSARSTMMRCGSQRKKSARMPLIWSSAKSRNSYIQSCTSVRPSACVASTVTRLTRSLGNPGQRPVVMRPADLSFDGSTQQPRLVERALHAEPPQHGDRHFDVLGARATDLDRAAGDRADDGPAAGVDVVAPQRVRCAAALRHAVRRGSWTCPPLRCRRPSRAGSGTARRRAVRSRRDGSRCALRRRPRRGAPSRCP